MAKFVVTNHLSYGVSASMTVSNIKKESSGQIEPGKSQTLEWSDKDGKGLPDDPNTYAVNLSIKCPAEFAIAYDMDWKKLDRTKNDHNREYRYLHRQARW